MALSPSSKLNGWYPSSFFALEISKPVFGGRMAGCLISGDAALEMSSTGRPKNLAVSTAIS